MDSHLGFAARSSKGRVAMKRAVGPRVLTSKTFLVSSRSTVAMGPCVPVIPALAMTMSRVSMPSAWSWRTASAGSERLELSILTRTRREPSAGVMARSSETAGAERSRTLPMTVWLGRERKVLRKPRPIPVALR